MLNSKLYDVLKWVALIAIPALSVCYSTIASIWGLPYSQEISATIGAIGVFLGALLQISTTVYNKKIDDDLGSGLEDE